MRHRGDSYERPTYEQPETVDGAPQAYSSGSFQGPTNSLQAPQAVGGSIGDPVAPPSQPQGQSYSQPAAPTASTNAPYAGAGGAGGGFYPPSMGQDGNVGPPPGGQGGPWIPGGLIEEAGGEILGRYGLQYGQKLLGTGQQQLNKYISIKGLKAYFNVNHSYVLNKLKVLAFPFAHKNWARRRLLQPQGDAVHLPPRDDVNAPDLYIPIMGFVTYVLVMAIALGVNNRFHPGALGTITSTGLGMVLIEVLSIKLGLFLTDVHTQVTIWDLIAYTGYKYVGLVVSIVLGILLGSMVYYILMVTSSLFMGVFMVC